MLQYIFALILTIIMLLAIGLNKAYTRISHKEVRRQAQRGSSVAKVLYKPISYGDSLQILLWVIILLSAAGSCVLFASAAPVWLAFLLILLLLGLGFWWLPSSPKHTLSGHLAIWLASSLSKLLYYVHPLIIGLSRLTHNHYAVNGDSGIYEEEDLLELLNWQKDQSDNRIPVDILDRLIRDIKLDQQIVRDILIPKSKVPFLSDKDAVGPLFIDGLHKSGLKHFPVYSGKKDKVVAILHLEDITSLKLKPNAIVADYMSHDVSYVRDDFSWQQVLRAFIATGSYILIVINAKQEFIGAIDVGKIMKLLTDAPGETISITYDDIASVASFVEISPGIDQIDDKQGNDQAEVE